MVGNNNQFRVSQKNIFWENLLCDFFRILFDVEVKKRGILLLHILRRRTGSVLTAWIRNILKSSLDSEKYQNSFQTAKNSSLKTLSCQSPNNHHQKIPAQPNRNLVN